MSAPKGVSGGGHGMSVAEASINGGSGGG